MPTTYSYARILHAIGQVLDQLGAKSFAIHEEEDGLFVEGFNSDGQLQIQMRYDIASLYELLSRNEMLEARPETTTEAQESTLHRFLLAHDRELVTLSR